MSIRRFIAQKDTTIVASRPGCPETNYGKDEILQLGKALESSTSGSARILVKFAEEDLASIASLVGDKTYRTKLHLNVANVESLPERLEVVGVPIFEYWEEGFGKAAEEGNLLGATWTYRMPGVPWTYPGAVDPSYEESASLENPVLEAVYPLVSDNFSGSSYSEEFSGYSPCRDISMDITELVKAWIDSSLDNNGMVLFIRDADHWVSNYGTRMSFFSADTHTIYQPYLELEWNDSEFDIHGTVPSGKFSVSVSNLHSAYSLSDVVNFELNVRDLYPSRVFTTSSLYKQNYILPKNSLWGIKDEYTNEMVIDFDKTYTKVSSKEGQSYFNLDMGLLYPERYYRLLFEVPSESGSKVVDNKIIFKVIRNGRVF